MPTKIIMPQLGESVIEGTVSSWLKKEGDSVQEMDALLEVSTDKVNSEIPSPASGVLLKIVVPEGETVNAGTVIAWVGQPGEVVPGNAAPGEAEGSIPSASSTVPETASRTEMPSRQAAEGEDGKQQPASPVSVPAPGRSRELGFISPIVARLAQEHQVDLTRVSGTGEGGRITKKDVLGYIERSPRVQETQAEPWETPGEGDLFRPTEMVFAQGRPEIQKAAPEEAAPAASAPAEAARPPQMTGAQAGAAQPAGQLLPHTNMRRKIAEHMVASKRISPHVTTVMEADLHRMLAHYAANKEEFNRSGVKLTYTAYFVSAAVQALRAFPLVNSSWTEEGVLIHPRINIGLAVSLGEEGLIVPVLKDAEALSLLGTARAIGDLASRARGHKLAPDDVQGGTFTITNHGISGSLFATPVINQPQCAILGVGAVQKRVVVIEDPAGGDSMAIRPMVYLSLTFDHRILDGSSADGFLAKVVEVLESWK